MDFRCWGSVAAGVYGSDVPLPRWSRWAWPAMATPAAADRAVPLLDTTGRHAGRERSVDVLLFVLAVTLGALFLSPELHDNPDPWPARQVFVDAAGGALASLALMWRRRWPVAVAVLGLLAGIVSTSATPAGLLALSSLAVHRPARRAALVALLWVPSLLAFAAYSPTTGPISVVAFVMPLALAATGWGMFIRARRQLLLSLRERTLRAEADRELHEEHARVAERTRIAREMHDVLAHRISLIALHAGGLELRPDLPPAEVEQTAALLRTTAAQALDELRGVIGVLREDTGTVSAAPQPTLNDIRRLVDETRSAGTDIDFEMLVEHADAISPPLGRDAYRIVQEALTNVGKHARGAQASVRVTGGPAQGLHISVRNQQPVPALPAATLPGAGAGLLGLRERVALAGGTIELGPDESGDFVVEANLSWRT
jgi:signal transduction histidine kinase